MKKLLKISLLSVLSLAVFLGFGLGKTAKAAEAHSSSFNLVLSDSKAKLKKSQPLGFDVMMFNNSQKIMTFEFAIQYDSRHFDFGSEIQTGINGLRIDKGKADPNQGSDGIVQTRLLGLTYNPISQDAAKLLSFSLTAKAEEVDTNILLIVRSIGTQEGVGTFGVHNIGLNAVSFKKTVIPWWIWLVLGIGVVLTAVGGYLMMLFFGAVINRFIQRTAQKIAETTKKIFTRRPQAPKLKASGAKSATVQNVEGTKPNAKPNAAATKTDRNITTVKTRVVNPDGSVTTITKKIVDDEQNKKEF
jgi:hypothetical protein